MANSSKFSEMCHPFGYLKASSSLTAVNLFVMPYNYPVLLPLLGELWFCHCGRVIVVVSLTKMRGRVAVSGQCILLL